MRKPKPPLPLWAKSGKRIWIEVRDKQELMVLEFLEGIITEANHDNKVLRVKYLSNEDEREVRGDRIHERLETHKLVDDLSNIPILNELFCCFRNTHDNYDSVLLENQIA